MTAGLRSLMTVARRERITAHVARKGALKAYAFQLAEPPTEMQLWNVGDNATDFGNHRWTDRSAREVMARYLERGNPLQLDVDHNYSGAEVPVDGTLPSAGYARLELRNGAPWLVFDWSAYAIDQIATKQRRFLSPEYDVDKETGEIVALYRVSLVADPATHHARQLARVLASANAGEKPMNLAMMMAAITAANAAEDPKVAKANVDALCASWAKAAGAGGEGGGDDPPKPDEQAGAGDPPPPSDDDKKKEEVARAAAGADEDKEKKDETARAAAAAKIAASSTNKEVIAVAQSVAGELAARDEKIAKLEADAAARGKREVELEADNRVAAAGERIPEALRAFAKKLSKADFETFVKGLPEVKGAPAKRVAAAAHPTRGSGQGSARPEGSHDPDAARVLARMRGPSDKAESPVKVLPDGRIRLSCLARPKDLNATLEDQGFGIAEGGAQ